MERWRYFETSGESRDTRKGRGGEQYEFVTKMDNFPLLEFHCNIAKQLIKCESFHCKYTMLFQLPVYIYIYIRIHVYMCMCVYACISIIWNFYPLRKNFAGTNIFSDTRFVENFPFIFFFSPSSFFLLSFIIISRNEINSFVEIGSMFHESWNRSWQMEGSLFRRDFRSSEW